MLSWQPDNRASAGQFERQGFKFDVGSSMMFGLSECQGGSNLITKALANLGRRVDTVADPAQLVYHLPRSNRFPQGLEVGPVSLRALHAARSDQPLARGQCQRPLPEGSARGRCQRAPHRADKEPASRR